MIIQKYRSNFKVNLSDRELGMIQKGILHITKELDWELQIRTGYTESKYLKLVGKLAGSDNSEYLLSAKEIMMIDQMLNEICNGIRIPTFERVLGINREETEKILEQLSLLIK